jgi:hypothetical protein
MPLYRDEVLEKHVEVEYVVVDEIRQFRPGVIKEVKLKKVNGITRAKHYVKFQDGDSDWIDLAYLEFNGSIRWDDVKKESSDHPNCNVDDGRSNPLKQPPLDDEVIEILSDSDFIPEASPKKRKIKHEFKKEVNIVTPNSQHRSEPSRKIERMIRNGTMPKSIDQMIRLMDEWEPGSNYYIRQQDSRAGAY